MRAILVPVLALLVAGCSAPADVPVTLSAGQRLELVHETTETVIQTAKDTKDRRVQNVRLRFDLEVVSAGAEGMEIRQTLAGVKIQNSDGDRTAAFDSDSGESPPPSAVSFAAMIGHGVTLHLDAAGRLESVSGEREMFQSAMGHLSASLSGEMLEMIREILARKMVFEGVGWWSRALPERGAGGSWNQADSLITYTLATDTRWKRNAELVQAGRMTLTPQPAQRARPLGVANVTYSLEGTGEASLNRSAQTGWLEAGEQSWKVAGVMTGADGSEWPVTVETETRITCRVL